MIDRPPPVAIVQETPPADIAEFIRFCHARRGVGWPDLYDEMCAVASRRAFRGWGFVEMAEHGICFTLADLRRLAEETGVPFAAVRW